MASEYLMKKYKDVKPDEERVLTKAEQRRNWWYYHKWYVAGGILAGAFCLSILWSILGIGRVYPDVSIAYISSIPLTEDTVEALRSGFAEKTPDLNGDGQVVVNLNQYVSYVPEDQYMDSEMILFSQATQVQMVADISECTSYFFLLEDPHGFQEMSNVLCNLDGSLPPDGDVSADGKYLLWSDCPELAGMELGEAEPLISKLAFARRGFWNKKTVDNPEGCAALWDSLTAGAVTP